MSIGGPQYPLLTRLSTALSRYTPNAESHLSLFLFKINDLITKREGSATRPLDETSVEKSGRMVIQDRGAVDVKGLYGEIPHEGFDMEVLAEAVRRLEKESRGGGELASNEKGVRQL
jgi:hypothetical protein